MIWRNAELLNPLSGNQLKRDSPHSFSDGESRFPVIEEIPFLRLGRDLLNRQVLQKLDAGETEAALMLLLSDQDDWAQTPAPVAADLQLLFDNPNLNLREAMRYLKYGAVADYFAYRWSDPTFLSGLCLLNKHLPSSAKTVFELCCGIGHFLREFELRKIKATGADVVFSKLWLARKFVAPTAKLVCVDANFRFPFADNSFDASICHDAFYFLGDKCRVAAELKRTTERAILIGHAHNRAAQNFSSGAAASIEEYAAMFDNPILYDDAELTKALLENRTPNANKIEELKTVEAVAIVRDAFVDGEQNSANEMNFDLPPAHRSLQINPLLDAGNYQTLQTPKYPSERYEKEYAPLSDYLILGDEEISFSDQETIFNGDWERESRLVDLVRRRIFLDLPQSW